MLKALLKSMNMEPGVIVVLLKVRQRENGAWWKWHLLLICLFCKRIGAGPGQQGGIF